MTAFASLIFHAQSFVLYNFFKSFICNWELVLKERIVVDGKGICDYDDFQCYSHLKFLVNVNVVDGAVGGSMYVVLFTPVRFFKPKGHHDIPFSF